MKNILFFMFFFAVRAQAQISIVVFPSTCSNNSSGTAFTNPSNGTAEDGNRATNTGASSDLLYCSGYNANVPAQAVITGFQFGVKKNETANSNVDKSTRLFYLGVATGTDKSDGVTDWPASLTWVYYGGINDTWDTTPTPAMVNDVSFGTAISANKTSVGATAYGIDVEQLTIYVRLITTITSGTIPSGTLK